MSETNIRSSIETLGNQSGDRLRAAQRLMAYLADSPEQSQALMYAMQAFTELTHPQRITLLVTVKNHLESEKYTCLAIMPNRLIIEHVLNILERELSKKEGFLFKREVHGTKEEVTRLVSLIQEIRAIILQISFEETDLHISCRLTDFLEGLSDNQFERLIRFVTSMRDIKACRDRYHEVVDNDYIARQLGEIDHGIFGLNINNDFLHFLQVADRRIVNEMASMGFLELTLLIDELEYKRSRKFTQGRVRKK